MNTSANTAHLLRDLSEGDYTLDSTKLRSHSRSFYLSCLGFVDTVVLPRRCNGLRDKALQLNDKLRDFLLTSLSLRHRVDKILAGHFYGDDTDYGVIDQVTLREELEEIITRVLVEIESTPGGGTYERLRKIGFCIEHVVVDQFPIVLNAIEQPHEGESRQWSERQDLFGLFESYMSQGVGHEHCAIRPLNALEVDMIEAAVKELGEISSHILQDVCLNVRHLCKIDYARWRTMSESEYREIGQSVSSHLLPSVCFFSSYSLSDKFRLMESMYHEALHKKLSNALLDGAIIRKSYDPRVTPKFTSYWNENSEWNPNTWGLDRSLFAYHVYTHLLLYYRTLASHRVYRSDPRVAEQLFNTEERANALGNWIMSEGQAELTARGKEFCRLLRERGQRVAI